MSFLGESKNSRFLCGLTPRCLWVLAVLVLAAGFAGCGGSETSSSPDPEETLSPEPPETAPSEPTRPVPTPLACSTRDEPWQENVFCPEESFYQYCEDPRKAASEDARQGTYVDENNWLRSWSHRTYLWYDEIEDTDPACCTTPEYFELMKTKETTSSGKAKDRFHYSSPTEQYRRLSEQGIAAGYGARFRILRSSPPRKLIVTYTEPGSPAASAAVNFVRGTEILGVDGIDIVNSTSQEEIERINAALSPSEGDTHTFTVKNPGTHSSQRSVTMTAREITVHPVQNAKILINSNGDRVGYMLFNTHIVTAARPLIDAANMFSEGEGIDDLIVDLRYNSGGTISITQIIASMVAGSAGRGKTFAEIQYNDKRDGYSIPFTDVLRYRNGSTERLPALDLPRLFVLTTEQTASASELIINSLLGIGIDVIRIGSTTRGKYHGFFPQDNCGTTYFSIQLKIVNDRGEADYDNGFSPSCFVADNDYSYQLGDPREKLLRTALGYQSYNSCPFLTQAQAKLSLNSSNLQDGSLSIDPVNSGYSDLPGLIVDRQVIEKTRFYVFLGAEA